ncbi:MAG: sigma-70 family RNA polymerase sigma factor [Proteobacteria bacterium]|nr:sigma-70 family RNA polymerase sigma factor [Pseudomonadota bacterium]
MTSARDFEKRVLPHLHAAFNLARWLVHDDHVAEDMVQDAYLRAYRYFASLREGDARPWLLGIVRNNCFTWLEEQRLTPGQVELDDELIDTLKAPEHGQGMDPGAILDQEQTRKRVDDAIRALAPPFREVVVLRELEGMSYAEIAQIAAIPIGTVMSRLSRARSELKGALAGLWRNQ